MLSAVCRAQHKKTNIKLVRGQVRFRIQGQKDSGSGSASKNLSILTLETVSKLSEK
jgi:hypothetical protein